MPDAPFKAEAQVFPASPAGQPWPLSARTQWLLAAGFVAFQVGLLVAMIVVDGLPYVFGERLKLQVIPIDPRDMFRGDYVVLGYDFNNIQPGRVQGLPDISADVPYREAAGRDVFVKLKPQGDHYVADSMSVARPALGPYLRGRMIHSYRAEFGIEAYYVQEGEGRRLENVIRQRRLLAEVAVWNGQAKLVRLVE